MDCEGDEKNVHCMNCLWEVGTGVYEYPTTDWNGVSRCMRNMFGSCCKYICPFWQKPKSIVNPATTSQNPSITLSPPGKVVILVTDQSCGRFWSFHMCLIVRCLACLPVSPIIILRKKLTQASTTSSPVREDSCHDGPWCCSDKSGLNPCVRSSLHCLADSPSRKNPFLCCPLCNYTKRTWLPPRGHESCYMQSNAT